MRTIFISNYDDRNKIPDGAVSKEWVQVGEMDTCLDLAMKAGQLSSDEETVLFISLEISSKIYRSSEQAGSQVLEFIRFTETLPDNTVNRLRDAHCVVYSISSFDSVLRNKPEQTVLYSPGTTFIGKVGQGRFDLDLNSLVKKRFDRSRWVETVQKSTLIETDNHSVANWWGVHRLAQVHSAVTKAEYVVYEIKPELQKLENLRAIAFYSPAITSSSISLEKEKLKQIDKLRNRINKRRLKIVYIDDDWNKGWARLFSHILFGKEVTEIDDHCGFKVFAGVSGGSLWTLSKFPEPSQNKGKEFVENIVQRLEADFSADAPDIVLLDLRLSGAREVDTTISEITGVQLLRWCREMFCGIPVIMTTASNKAWSIEKLLQVGGDAYWIKEGIDGRTASSDSIENYRRFLELVDRASGDKYRFLSLFAGEVERHKKKTDKWYKSPYWSSMDAYSLTDEQINTINRILNETVSLLRSYLHSSVMKYEYRSEKNETHLITNIVTYSFHVIELIHNPSNQNINISELMNSRNDRLGKCLRELRNDYAHLEVYFSARKNLGTFVELQRFLIALLAYLDLEPYGCKEELTRDQILTSRHYKEPVARFSEILVNSQRL